MNQKVISKKKKDLLEAIKDHKARQAKDKRSAKKVMGAVQANNQEQIREYVLHMRKITTSWEQLANGSYVGKSKCGCIFEIRPSHTKTTVRYLQSISRGPRCRFLPQDASRDWPRSNGATPKRQAGKRKSHRPLLKTDFPLPKYFRRINW